jgi:hypothetical protein
VQHQPSSTSLVIVGRLLFHGQRLLHVERAWEREKIVGLSRERG